MSSKFARGLGEGMARTGELLLLDSLARAREDSIARLRAEYGMQQAKAEHGMRMDEAKYAAGENAKEGAAERASRERIAKMGADVRDPNNDLVKIIDVKKVDPTTGMETTETVVEILDPRTRAKVRMPYADYEQRYLKATQPPAPTPSDFKPKYLDPSQAPAYPGNPVPSGQGIIEESMGMPMPPAPRPMNPFDSRINATRTPGTSATPQAPSQLPGMVLGGRG